jgi:Outer membrane protein and related peptidoglycan-associated (lipo)proteins
VNDPRRSGDRAGRSVSRSSFDDKDLDERERYELKRLRASIGGGSLSPEGVGEVLPEAVVISQAGDGRLPKSLVETTEKAIGLSVEQDPEILSAALFPIIGSAIRKAVEKLVSELLYKMNAGLEKGLSLKRLGWRIEALRSGAPYYEIILKHTLDYRVEHVFLIHKATGLLLAEVSQPGPSNIADMDLVAGMLTAVRDYIKDSLSLERSEAVNVLSAGEYSIFVEEGPLALIALVVRGTADPAIRSYAQDALETVHTRLGPELRSFEGEVEPFEKAGKYLSSCLVSAEKGANGKKPVYAIALICAIAAIGCLFIARGAFLDSRDRAFIAALNAEPGIVVVDSYRSGSRLKAKIMRSVNARPISAVAAEKGFDLKGAEIKVELYLPAEGAAAPNAAAPAASAASAPAATAPRAEVSAEPAPTAIAAQRNVRPLPVQAPPAQEPRSAATQPKTGPVSRNAGLPSPEPNIAAPNVAPRSTSSVQNASAELAALVAQLESESILFDKDSRRPAPGQEERVRRIRASALALIELARKSGLTPRIEAIGHAAGAVSDATGDSLSVARARAAVALVSGGEARLEPFFTARGTGNAEPLASEDGAAGSARNRSVSFAATFR